MDLLGESRKIWLSSFIVCTVIPFLLRIFRSSSIIGRTIRVQFEMAQLVVLFFFIYIVCFKAVSRFFPFFSYLMITIVFGIRGYIHKWYIIIPIFIILELYIVWNLGGVINCIIASPYKERINEATSLGEKSYGKYAKEIKEYNQRNDLKLFSGVRRKWEPRWGWLDFNFSGCELFSIEKALLGIGYLVERWEKNETKLNNINSGLKVKRDVIKENIGAHEEKKMVGDLIKDRKEFGLQSKDMEQNQDKLNEKIKGNLKAEKRILRKRL